MPTKLSVIDLAPALTGEEGADKVARDLRHAAETLGFFYIVNHGVPEELMNGVYSHLKTFFDLPLETKMDTHVSKVNGGVRGYIGLYEQGNYGLDSTDRRDAAPGIYVHAARGLWCTTVHYPLQPLKIHI